MPGVSGGRNPWRARANEAVWVATLSGSRVIVLHHEFRPDNTVQILEVGAAIPWHACALGHAIVACMSEGQRARALAGGLHSLTGQTKITKTVLNRSDQVRQRGYAVEDQEATVGDAGIAAPILARDALVAGAIAVVGPPTACSGRSVPVVEVIRAVAEAARAVSRDLGAGRSGLVLSALI